MDQREGWTARRSPRLAGYDYGQVGLCFVTICIWDREPLLGEVSDAGVQLSSAGRVVQNAWASLPLRFPTIDLDAFVIMPDHVHGIVILGSNPELPPATPTPTLSAIIRAFKSLSGLDRNHVLGGAGRPFWHRSFYDRIIRNERELTIVRRYIADHPVQSRRTATLS